MIKAIIFDFFGVLSTEGFKRFCDTYFPDDQVRRKQAIRLVTDHDAGLITKNEYAKGLAKLARVSLDIVAQNMGDNTPNDPLLAYIKRDLKPKYKISVLSNAGDDYISQILDPADLAIFDDVVLSYRHGMVKPQKEIFEFAVRRLKVLPVEAVFIDDSVNHCAGAVAAGLKAVHYTDFPQMRIELEKLLAPDSNN